MKKLTRWAVCLGLCLALTVCAALAAGEKGISVQLDGRDITFTDAVPQVKNQRTFLPFRAVFEAMGADVDWAGNVVTAVRGDKALTMTIGSTRATVVEGGVERTIEMDVAPYLDPAISRTYVPVRFAAQAFGCAVGWDQEAQTAVIVDTEKLVAEAKEGRSYTYLEQFAALGETYREGIWDLDMEMKVNVSMTMPGMMMSVPIVTAEGTVDGTVADSAKLDMSMNMKADMTKLADAISLRQLPDETLAMLDFLKNDGVNAAVRGDMDAGKLYMNVDLGALAIPQAGLDADAWYELDMAAAMGRAGADRSERMTANKGAHPLDNLISNLGASYAPNSAATGYDTMKTSLEELFSAFADDRFFTDTAGEYWYLDYTTAAGEGDLSIFITLPVEREGYYSVLFSTTTPEGDSTSFGFGMTADGAVIASMDLKNSGTTFSWMMEGSITPGTAAPVVTPPEGAKIVPYTDLAGQGSAGIIGGPDGPIAVF